MKRYNREKGMMTKKVFLKKFKEQWFTYLFLIVTAVFVAFPIFWMISISFRENGEVFQYPANLLPPTFTLEAYIEVMTSSKIMTYFFNSYLNGFIVTVLSLIIGVMAGYVMSRFEFRGKRIFNLFVVTTQTIPRVTLLIPFFVLFVSFGLYDTRHGLLIAYTSFALPYAIIMMLGFFNSIPTELDEAARIDGAGHFRTLWQIIAPVAIPGIVSTMIYVFIISWNEYIFVMALIKNDALKTVPVGIALLKGEAAYEWNTLMAMSILGSIPVLVFYLFGQRKFISGLASGAIKG